jgi:hypothetical protein
MEHFVKSIASVGRGGSRSVSAAPPSLYSNRFQEFLSHVFV